MTITFINKKLQSSFICGSRRRIDPFPQVTERFRHIVTGGRKNPLARSARSLERLIVGSLYLVIQRLDAEDELHCGLDFCPAFRAWLADGSESPGSWRQ